LAAKVFLLPGREKRLLAGHLWVYGGEIQDVVGPCQPGDVVEVYTSRKRFLGVGYYNPFSQITVRLLAREKTKIDREFFRKRLLEAGLYRDLLLSETNAYRLVSSEGDFLPGLIVDQYGEYLVVQFLTLGMERQREVILSLLKELFFPRGIYERSEGSSREKEGLPGREGLLWGEVPPRICIREGDLRFYVDIYRGQKTGFFLDQRENRKVLQGLCQGKRVLDCFCYTGGFAVAAAKGGAREVVAVDISPRALEGGRDNAQLNQVEDRIRWVEANCFDQLRLLERAGEKFDVVVLDPPAFTKSKESLPSALRGYKEINLRALKLLHPGGVLFTCSCSYHLTEPLFWQVVLEAAQDAGRFLRLIEFRRQARDHIILPTVPETYYLKCGIFQAL